MTLSVSHICKDYSTRTGPLTVLRDISLELAAGEALAVMGPSGSGKSTLMHILGTLDKPTSGVVELDGCNPFTLPERELAAFRNRHIGFIFQDHFLLPQCAVLENVLIPTLAAKEDRAAAETWRASCSSVSACRIDWTIARRSFPGANASAWPSHVR